MKEFWDERYSQKAFAYGTKPNVFFKACLDKYNFTGRILLPAEGEGRNAVYAAKLGLEVLAFDMSKVGKKKALQLANEEQVTITYEVKDLLDLQLTTESFDVAGLIYAHFPPAIRSIYHKKIGESIKPNGMIILEAFSTNHPGMQKIYPKVGGPKNIDMLYSIDLVQQDFVNFEPLLLEEKEIELNEGQFHIGRGQVIRFVGKKFA